MTEPLPMGLTHARDEEPMEALARDVLPALIARLGASSLGELEVATDHWRVRPRRRPARVDPALSSTGADRSEDGPAVARSPGVGYFDPVPALAVGSRVKRGDRIGSVEVLGVAQEVVVPVDGIVGRLHVQAGQAVEYGQPLATIGDDPGDGTGVAAEGELA